MSTKIDSKLIEHRCYIDSSDIADETEHKIREPVKIPSNKKIMIIKLLLSGFLFLIISFVTGMVCTHGYIDILFQESHEVCNITSIGFIITCIFSLLAVPPILIGLKLLLNYLCCYE
jgi:hypothetical protein